MRKIESIVEDVTEIYRKSGSEAEEYLDKARKLKEIFGPGPATVYCWFYSVPQKWTRVEPKIFELMKHTNLFNLDAMLLMPVEKIADALKPMIFYNKISLQLKNFCAAVKREYFSWDCFVDVLNRQNIFTIFESLRSHKSNRVTFKNLAAMKIFVGVNNDLVILDTHVARFLGIGKNEVDKYRTRPRLFKEMLKFSSYITNQLRKEFPDITMAKWSLAIWFDKTSVHANELLIQ